MIEQPTILLVEDDPDDEALALRAIAKSELTCEVVAVRDGVDALDWIFATGRYADRETKVMPSLILLDLKMPKVDGFEVLKKLKSNDRTKLTPVVVLTSSKEDRDISRAYDLGVNSYIRKPVAFENFMKVFQLIGNYWIQTNEPPKVESEQSP